MSSPLSTLLARYLSRCLCKPSISSTQGHRTTRIFTTVTLSSRGSAASCSTSSSRGYIPGSPRRNYSTYKTVQQQQSRYRFGGPFSWKAGLLFLLSGAGLIIYFQYEKARMERQRIAMATKGIGKPKVGGAFDLMDQHGRRFTSDDLRGRYALMYFGFSHCPDICPEELDKMAKMVDLVAEKFGRDGGSTGGEGSQGVMRPVFITCDPARDTPAVLDTYLKEFHPALIGLTGSWEAIKSVCKAYRVYFSTPPDVKPGQDYLVDHSIYFYLMDPEGDFVECIGKQHTAEQGAKIIIDHIGDWKDGFK